MSNRLAALWALFLSATLVTSSAPAHAQPPGTPTTRGSTPAAEQTIRVTPEHVRALADHEKTQRALAEFLGLTPQAQQTFINQRVVEFQRRTETLRKEQARVDELERERAVLPTDADLRKAEAALNDARNKLIKLILEKPFKTGDAATLKIGVKVEAAARQMFNAEKSQIDALLADDRRREINSELAKMASSTEKTKAELQREAFALLLAKPLADAMVVADQKQQATAHKQRADLIKQKTPKFQERSAAPQGTPGKSPNAGPGGQAPGREPVDLGRIDRPGGDNRKESTGGPDPGRVDLLDKKTGESRGGGPVGGVDPIKPGK